MQQISHFNFQYYKWFYPIFVAPPLDCVDPGPFPNGDKTGNFVHGSYVSFDCHTGYTLEGPDYIICDNGVWSESIAACRGE